MTHIEETAISAYPARLFMLQNDDLRVVLTDIGARLLELWVPDRDGVPADVVLGRANLTEAASDPHYMGSTAGRYANRIRRGKFTLDGRACQLTLNEGDNHLHGGRIGFDQRAWSATAETDAVTFQLVSADGEEGYPGTLHATARYALAGRRLEITLTATTDRPTIVNLVNHAYLNLAGHDSGSVLGHIAQIYADHYTPVDDELVPTGEIRSVADTPFDFRTPKRIEAGMAQVENGAAGRGVAGYDHNWVLNGSGVRRVARFEDRTSGRAVDLSTNQPGLQFYAGGYLAGVSAKGGGSYASFAGFTLETQTFPDSVNHPHFPSPVLRPGETYANNVALDFSWDG
ncbi:MAG TPA: aldose epimerase family protein [Streptosporangiaceae bacterium]|nr:aldose epimerase family protein [Streptosporangiaceae bacterium]